MEMILEMKAFEHLYQVYLPIKVHYLVADCHHRLFIINCLIEAPLLFVGKITLLDIGNNDIGSKGAFHVAEYIKKTKSLLWLNLYMNDIGDEVWSFIVVVLDFVCSLCQPLRVGYQGNLIMYILCYIFGLLSCN